MAYAVINSWDNDRLTLTIYDLQYEADRYQKFYLEFSGTRLADTRRTDFSTKTVSFTFDITRTQDYRQVANGGYTVALKCVIGDRPWDIPIRGNSYITINRENPRPNHMSWIKILDIYNAEEDYVNMRIKTNGYGIIDLVSVTKGWDLSNGEMSNEKPVVVDSFTVDESSIVNGYFIGNVIFNATRTDLSQFPSVPIGTCKLASDKNFWSGEYNCQSEYFLCLSQYNNWEIYRGIYSTTLDIYSGRLTTEARQLGSYTGASSVYKDWMRLINMSFYLESTVYGTIKYTQYSSYIPQRGDIITAQMYNALLDSVSRCQRQLNVWNPSLPNYAHSGDIISRNFIYDVGVVVDSCLVKQREQTNAKAISRW